MNCSNHTPVVLVVEDEPLLRELSVFVLEDAGYEVLEASTADQALQIMHSANGVRVLFTDVNMPGAMDGLELARRFHRRWPEVKLIVTSGAGRVRPTDVPGEGRFLAKPYALSELGRTIAELARQPDRGRASLQ